VIRHTNNEYRLHTQNASLQANGGPNVKIAFKRPQVTENSLRTFSGTADKIQSSWDWVKKSSIPQITE